MGDFWVVQLGWGVGGMEAGAGGGGWRAGGRTPSGDGDEVAHASMPGS